MAMEDDKFEVIYDEAIEHKIFPRPEKVSFAIDRALERQHFFLVLAEIFKDGNGKEFHEFVTYENYLNFLDEQEHKQVPREKTDKLVKIFSDLKIDGRINLLLFYLDQKFRNTLSAEEIEVAEYILNGKYPRLQLNGSKVREPNLKNETINIMNKEKLIDGWLDGRIFVPYPAARGLRINEDGGWMAYQEGERAKLQQQENDRQLTRDVARSSMVNNKATIANIIITTVIIGYGTWLTKKNYEISLKNADSKYIQDQQLLFQQQQQSQIYFHERQIDSLNKELSIMKTKLEAKNKPKKK